MTTKISPSGFQWKWNPSKLDVSANIEPFFDDIPDRNIYDSTCFHKLLMIYVKASHLSTIHYRALSSLIFVFLFQSFSAEFAKQQKTLNVTQPEGGLTLQFTAANNWRNTKFPLIDLRLWLLHLQSSFFGLLPPIKSFPRRNPCLPKHNRQ